MNYLSGRLMLLLVAGSALVLIAHAEEPAGIAGLQDPNSVLVCPDALLRGCCDGYCSKIQPCIPCYRRGCGCDDYRCKPSPCIACYRGNCAAYCYCPKPCPDLCRPLVADFFTCAAPNAPCAVTTRPGDLSPELLAEPVDASRQ